MIPPCATQRPVDGLTEHTVANTRAYTRIPGLDDGPRSSLSSRLRASSLPLSFSGETWYFSGPSPLAGASPSVPALYAAVAAQAANISQRRPPLEQARPVSSYLALYGEFGNECGAHSHTA